jgi:hypothetical protein
MEVVPGDKVKKKAKKSVNIFLFGLALFVVGACAMVVFRFVMLKSVVVHYHANFALYVNGQKDEFKNFTFYEEVAACTVDDPDDVKRRVHLHSQNPGLVHIHAHGVTWSQFFANLGYTLGNKVLVTDNGLYADGQDGNKLTFILNDQPVDTVENRVITSNDTLLINYGKDDANTLNSRYKAVPNDANTANKTKDPATCSGSQGLTFTNRLKQALGFNPLTQ